MTTPIVSPPTSVVAKQQQPSNTTVLITGSLTGIGLGIAQTFVKQKNINLMLNGLDATAESTIESLRHEAAADTKVEYTQADISKSDQVEKLIQNTIQVFGKLDVLINNAGIQYVAPIEEFPVNKWDQIIAVNLSSVFHTIHFALPYMRKHGFGRIINVASVHGLMASPHKVAYIAAKHGVVGITKTVALEVAKDNITCCAVCPGWVLTPLVEKQVRDRTKITFKTFEEELTALVGEKMPSGRPATVAEIGACCVFLADPNNKSMNGSSLLIDGAWTAGKL